MLKIYNNIYKWSATSWGPDGTLIGGLAGNDVRKRIATNLIAGNECPERARGRFDYGSQLTFADKPWRSYRTAWSCLSGCEVAANEMTFRSVA